MKRHNARIIGVMTVFNLDMNKDLNIIEEGEESNILSRLLETKEEVKSIILDDEYSVEIDDDFLSTLLKHIGQNYSKIKELVSNSLVNWTIDRLSYVDRAIMICACSEMLQGETHKKIIINEYLDITREYSMINDELQVKFNNKVLDNIARNIYE